MENLNQCELTIVLPAYNEDKRLEKCINKTIKTANLLNIKYEIIISENGSTDTTYEIAENLSKKYDFIHLLHNDIPSLSGAIKNAYSIANGNVVVNLDVDLATDMSYFKELVDYSKYYDVVTGSRYIDETLVKRNLSRYILSQIFNKILIRGLLRSKLKDNNCGFRAIRKNIGIELFNDVQDEGVFGLIEFIILAQRKGYSIKEFPVRWRENPRKITIKDILNYLIPGIKLIIRLL